MTDEAYAFRETEKERKRLARGAFAKKGGSRSKKCSLPSDRLTEKQRKEMNGKVESYKLNRPMKWKEFSYMPEHIRLLYLRNLVEQHKGRRKDIADMFGITPNGLTNYIRHNFPGFHPFDELGGQKYVSPEWTRFLSPDEAPVAEVKEPAEEENAPEAPISAVKQAYPFELSSGELKFSGNLRCILSKLLIILEPSTDYDLTIQFSKSVVE